MDEGLEVAHGASEDPQVLKTAGNDPEVVPYSAHVNEYWNARSPTREDASFGIKDEAHSNGNLQLTRPKPLYLLILVVILLVFLVGSIVGIGVLSQLLVKERSASRFARY